MDDLQQLAELGSTLSVELINGDNKTVVKCPNYYGTGDYWWFGTDSNHRPTLWDRTTNLSIQLQPFEQVFSFGRKRLMALVGKDVNPKLRFMSCYEQANLLVSGPGELIWNSENNDGVEALAEAVTSGASLRIAFSEDGEHWYSSRVDSAQVNAKEKQFCLQNDISHWPTLPFLPDEQQKKNIDDVVNYLTQNNTLQLEDPRCKSNMAEFKMDYIDMWRALFEKGVMFTAYSAKEGMSFKYKALKVFVESPKTLTKVAL